MNLLVCHRFRLSAAVLVLLVTANSLAQQERPAWQTYPLTDVRSSDVFTLGDFAGRTVFVEGMATWCGHCLQQLRSVAVAKTQLDADAYVFIALSVDTNATAEELLNYAEKEGFDWTFAVVSPELLRELAAIFGQKITRPLSHFVIRPDGSSTDLDIGIKSPGALSALLIEARWEASWPGSSRPSY